MKFKHKSLQDYTFMDYIAKGTMANVLRVFDKDKKVYTLKILKDESYYKQFKKETYVINQLKESNTIQIYDSSLDESKGEVYMLMEHMKYGNLKEYRKKYGELSLEKKLLIIQDIADTLENANKKNIGHYDMRPENIYINDAEMGKEGYLGGFGNERIRKREKERNANDYLQFIDQVEPEDLYLPLEILKKEEERSMKSDLYALGMIMCELIINTYPYEVSYKKAFIEEREKDASLPILEYDKTIPDEVKGMCLKAIANDKKERYQSFDALSSDIEICIEAVKAYEKKDITRHEKENKELVRTEEKKLWSPIQLTILTLGLGYWYYPAIHYHMYKPTIEEAKNIIDEERSFHYTYKRDEKYAKKVIEEFEEKGDKEIMYYLGKIYGKGIGTKTDYPKAIEYYTKAVAKGEVEALIELGTLYARGGKGIKKDKSLALQYYEKAMVRGITSSLVFRKIGILYYLGGDGVQRNYVKAKNYMEEAINRKGNNIDLYSYLGSMHYQGKFGLEKNDEEAIKCYSKAYKLHDPNSYYAPHYEGLLGKLLYERYIKQNNIEDYKLATKYLKSASVREDPIALEMLGDIYINEKNYEAALNYYKRAIESNDELIKKKELIEKTRYLERKVRKIQVERKFKKGQGK